MVTVLTVTTKAVPLGAQGQALDTHHLPTLHPEVDAAPSLP